MTSIFTVGYGALQVYVDRTPSSKLLVTSTSRRLNSIFGVPEYAALLVMSAIGATVSLARENRTYRNKQDKQDRSTEATEYEDENQTKQIIKITTTHINSFVIDEQLFQF